MAKDEIFEPDYRMGPEVPPVPKPGATKRIFTRVFRKKTRLNMAEGDRSVDGNALYNFDNKKTTTYGYFIDKDYK